MTNFSTYTAKKKQKFHSLFEISDVGDNFCISLMQMNKKTKYMDSFCKILEEEKIPYKVLGMFKNHLPISKVASAPVIGHGETKQNKKST